MRKYYPNCIIYEDEHILVINKPAGVNTHSPSPYATNGIYDYLRNLTPEWANLAIIHRLDKETSGVIVFSKTKLANQSLTKQFTERTVEKKYVLITDRNPPSDKFSVVSHITKDGSLFKSMPLEKRSEPAKTLFRKLEATDAEIIRLCSHWVDYAKNAHPNLSLKTLIAHPLTGRTHQVRLHASEKGCPILGDILYGGTESIRIWLHSAELTLKHPQIEKPLTFQAPPAPGYPALSSRQMFLTDDTNSFRIIYGVADRFPGLFIDKLGDWLLVQNERELNENELNLVKTLSEECGSVGAYFKLLQKDVRTQNGATLSPRLIFGQPAPERFQILENGVKYELSFLEGYSVGLFLDQRDNRRRILANYVAKDFPLLEEGSQVLNTFAYTCGFSVCAAMNRFHTVNVDISAKYLEWGKRNFQYNGLDYNSNEFCKGDVFDWLKIFTKKGRKFDLIIIDPPTFSQSKKSGVFQAYKDYPELLHIVLKVLNKSGVLLASLNTATVPAEKFVQMFNQTITSSGKRISQYYFATQPLDFPSCSEQPAYLKTIWARIE